MSDTHTTAHIPDEAVQAAADKYSDGGGHGLDMPDIIEVSRDMIAAALPHLSAPCAVEVRQLEFVEVSYGFIAHTAFGTYKISVKWGEYEKVAMVIAGGELHKSFHDDTEAAKAAAQADFERRILSCIVTKPVDVAAVRKQAFEEGFENGVEQSLNALDAYDDITRNEAEQGIRKLKPDYRALSAEPAQGEQWHDIATAPKDGTDVLLKRTMGRPEIVGGYFDGAWRSFDQPDKAITDVTHWMPLPAAPTTEAQS